MWFISYRIYCFQSPQGPLGTSAKMRATSVLPWDLTAPFSLSIKAWKAGVAPGEFKVQAAHHSKRGRNSLGMAGWREDHKNPMIFSEIFRKIEIQHDTTNKK